MKQVKAVQENGVKIVVLTLEPERYPTSVLLLPKNLLRRWNWQVYKLCCERLCMSIMQ